MCVCESAFIYRVIFHFGPSTPKYSMLVGHIPIWSLRRISVFQLGSFWGGIFHFGHSFSTYIPLWPLSWSYSIMVRTDVVSALQLASSDAPTVNHYGVVSVWSSSSLRTILQLYRTCTRPPTMVLLDSTQYLLRYYGSTVLCRYLGTTVVRYRYQYQIYLYSCRSIHVVQLYVLVLLELCCTMYRQQISYCTSTAVGRTAYRTIL